MVHTLNTMSQEAIIPRDLFTQVQEEMVRRANMYSGEGKKEIVYFSKYALSSICTRTKCGDIYRHVVWNNRGKKFTVWRCCTRVENGPSACDAPTISEEELQQATVTAINQLMSCSLSMKEILMENIESAIADDNSGELETLNELLPTKQRELVKLAQAKKDYTLVADEVERLKEKKQQLLVARADTESFKKRIVELELFLQKANDELTEFNEAMVRKYIQEIKVYEDKLQVIFKAVIELDIER